MTQARGDHITTEFDALANELENMMNSTNLGMSPRCCIFKVPNILSEAQSKSLCTQCIFHRALSLWQGTSAIHTTNQIEVFARPHLWFSPYKSDDDFEHSHSLTRTISEVQQEARDCYAEPFDHISRDEFLKILLLDGCFLIELFRKNADKHLPKDDDPVFTRNCMCQFLCHDLILLENQIPWLVLELLFDTITRNLKDSPRDSQSLTFLVLEFFSTGGFRPSRLRPNVDALFQRLYSRERESKHILGMLRNSLVLSSSITHERSVEWQIMSSATRLREAGIKFKKGTSTSILDVKFKDGVLEIPQLLIQETTESLFRNLFCLEQCLPNCASIVTSYAVLLDNLINTTEDMEILCHSGIIDNWLDIDDATGFFNQLYHDTYVKEVYYCHLVAEVNEYCQRRWPRYA